MKKLLPVLISIFFFSYSCTTGLAKSEIFKNEKIDQKTRTSIAGLNKHAYTSMCDNSYGALSQLFSDSLLNSITIDFTRKFMPQIQKVIKGRQFRVFDEFYIRQAKAIDTVNIKAGQNDNTYALKYVTGYNETYITMLVAGDSVNEVMLTLIYINIDGKWKLNTLLGEDYSLAGRNAVAQYKHAKNLEKDGFLVDAVNIMALAGYCIAPGGNMFTYDKYQEMADFSDSLTSKTKKRYPIPFLVNELATKPTVVNIHYEVMDKLFTPMIVYQSTVNLSDTINLKKENDEMQRKIGSIFSGIDKTNNSILYRVYNALPADKNDQKPYYGYVQKIK